jgi:hypothetical protein
MIGHGPDGHFGPGHFAGKMPSADEIFKRMDKDGNGSVSKDEFTQAHEAFVSRFASHHGHHKSLGNEHAKRSDHKPAEKNAEPKKTDGKGAAEKKPVEKKPESKKSDE